jgi:hypothetical protein
MENINHTLVYTLMAYDRGKLGIGCMRFEHGGIHPRTQVWVTARQKYFLRMLKNFVRICMVHNVTHTLLIGYSKVSICTILYFQNQGHFPLFNVAAN